MSGGFFKTPRNKKFEYTSRFYDEEKEELEYRKKKGGSTIRFSRHHATGVGSNRMARLILLIVMGAAGVMILFMGVSVWSMALLIALLGMVYKFSKRA